MSASSYKGCVHRLQSGAPFPDTALSAAFLRALVRLVGAHRSKPKLKIAIPTGITDVDELTRVLRALQLAREFRDREYELEIQNSGAVDAARQHPPVLPKVSPSIREPQQKARRTARDRRDGQANHQT